MAAGALVCGQTDRFSRLSILFSASLFLADGTERPGQVEPH